MGVFDAELKVDILNTLVSFDEVIILELRYVVCSMAADEIFCKLEMDALIFQNNHE